MVSAIKRGAWNGITSWISVWLLLWAMAARAEEFRLESVGVRGGFSANTTGQIFDQAEVFANWNLPWGWDLGKEWHLQSQLDLSGGWLSDRKDNAGIGTVGPGLLLSRAGLPLSLDGGVSPTVISQYDFESRNFGTYIQFTTHIGLNWDFAAHWRVGYRFGHMSNADLASPNRGLNTHMLALSYVF
jgi:hypothetical protein